LTEETTTENKDLKKQQFNNSAVFHQEAAAGKRSKENSLQKQL
jgi:hypothetical protein